MFIIKASVKGYEGKGYGLNFVKGEATTEDERIAEMLKRKGYTVESPAKPPAKPKTETKKANAKKADAKKAPEQKPEGDKAPEQKPEGDNAPEQKSGDTPPADSK